MCVAHCMHLMAVRVASMSATAMFCRAVSSRLWDRVCMTSRAGAVIVLTMLSSQEPQWRACFCSGDSQLVVNFEAAEGPAHFAQMYKLDDLKGGHVIMLGADEESR